VLSSKFRVRFERQKRNDVSNPLTNTHVFKVDHNDTFSLGIPHEITRVAITVAKSPLIVFVVDLGLIVLPRGFLQACVDHFNNLRVKFLKYSCATDLHLSTTPSFGVGGNMFLVSCLVFSPHPGLTPQPTSVLFAELIVHPEKGVEVCNCYDSLFGNLVCSNNVFPKLEWEVLVWPC